MTKPTPKLKTWDWGLALLLLWGVFSPTSIGGDPSSPLVLVSMILYLLLVAWALWRFGVTNAYAQVSGMLVIGLPLAFTFTASGTRVAWGKAMFFVMLAAAYFPKLRPLTITRRTRILFNAVSVVLLVIAATIMFAPSLIEEPLLRFYADFYPELMPNMLKAGKPVGTFTSHNVAALFYYLFFYLHARSYSVYSRFWNLLMALAFLAIIPFLKSNSGLAFAVFGFFEILYILYRSRGVTSKIFGLGLLLAAMSAAAAFNESIAAFVATIVGSKANGLAGRFASTGNLRGNIDYIVKYPFSPVGFQYKNELFYGDCGYIEMMIRGSLPMVLAAYGGLVAFLRQNLATKNDLRAVLTAIVVMEIGFSNLISLRFLFILPFLIVYLNGLEDARLARLAARAAAKPRPRVAS